MRPITPNETISELDCSTAALKRISFTAIPGSQPPVHNTEPFPAVAQPSASPDWTIDKDFGCLCYKGQHGEMRITGVMWMYGDAAFAQGFWRGRALMLEREDGDWYILTDQEFTHLIAQELPATLPAVAIDPWKRGFIFGWCMTWHFQPFLDEEAEMRKRKSLVKRSRKQKRAKRGPRACKPRD